jgi:osmoprotectant transport system ATP-binding protein
MSSPEETPPAAVEFRRAGFGIRGRVVLEDLSFRIEPGETLVLLGLSGAGKTTALKMVNGMVFPTSGEVLVDGRATTAWDLIRLRRGIGYVIQDVGLFPHFTVAQNVGLVPRLEGWPPERIAARTNDLLELVGLPPGEFLTRYPRQLSGGQRQRVGVARALAADPRLLLFDEPFGAVDPVTRLDLQDQFLALRDRLHKTSIFVTHDVREALRIGSRIALFDSGRLETLASPEQFLKSPGPQTCAFLAVLDSRPRG